MSSKKYRLINRARINAYGKNYRNENKEKLLALSRNWMRKKRLAVLSKIAEAHSTSILCLSCSFTDLRALQIDHVNGGGTKETEKLNSYNFYKHILGLPLEEVKKQYQLLCANCNMIKKEENRENYIWKTNQQVEVKSNV